MGPPLCLHRLGDWIPSSRILRLLPAAFKLKTINRDFCTHDEWEGKLAARQEPRPPMGPDDKNKEPGGSAGASPSQRTDFRGMAHIDAAGRPAAD